MEHSLQSKAQHFAGIAEELFGYAHLRPGQEAALHSIFEGHDTLVVMPTGSGKSMIYQAAGKLLAGPTVIVSPLIALQWDQVELIEEQDLGSAALVNSCMRPNQVQETFNETKAGKLEFLFLAPEQFHIYRFFFCSSWNERI